MVHHRTKRPQPPTTLGSSQISQRLEKLRERRRNLWDDDNEENHSEVTKRKSRAHIILSDSDDDDEQCRPQTKKRSKRKKSQCCLICSILNQLSSENCCAKHLSLLKNRPSNSSSSSSSLILPNHVMIVPVHDHLLHEYLDSHEIHRLKIKTASIATQTKKSVKQNQACQVDDIYKTNSSITFQTSPRSEIIIIDDSPVDDPWTPLPDGVDAAIEGLLSQIETEPVYTPTTARKTETEFMAARLPKIPLKEGRFRLGKPTAPQPTETADDYRPSNNVLTQDTSTTNPPDSLPSAAASSNGSARVSYRTNPDGTSVQISRPQFSGSPSLHLLRRNSTDVTPKPL